MITKKDYKEMEVLVNGSWNKKDVLMKLADGTCLYLVGTKTSAGSYVMGGCVAGEACREIKLTKTVVKSAVEIVKLLVEAGYTCDSEGDWDAVLADIIWTSGMFATCGKEPTSRWNYEPEWLEEVPVEDK